MTRILLIAEVVAPVRLAQDTPVESADPLAPWIAMACISVAVAFTALGVWRWAQTRRLPDEERAFRALAWRMRLGPVSRREIRSAAARSGMPAVALLLSEGARSAAGLSMPRVPADPT